MKSKGKKQKIEVDNFTINRSMGESFDWKKLNITKKQVEALNEIGHRGKHRGKKTTVQQYFDKHIDKNGLKHQISEMSSNNMEFTDKLLVTRVTLK